MSRISFAFPNIFSGSRLRSSNSVGHLFLVFALLSSLEAREKSKITYGAGLSVQIESPESEVLQAVGDVVDDGIIEGTKEYNKDENIAGAAAVPSSPLYPSWTAPGKVFYKVKTQVIDPRNFKDGGDVGTIAVRYVVQSLSPKQTSLRIDAVFVEDFRHTVHPSSGLVESAEYKDITDHLDEIHLRQKEAAESASKREEYVARRAIVQPMSPNNEASRFAAAKLANQTLEQHVQDLRRQVERRVVAAGAILKSAPFHTASTLKPLPANTDVVVLIVTPYWFGVETQDGQHGWVFKEQLEVLP